MTAQAALNVKPARFLDWVAKRGEGGDDHVGHLSTGDAVIPVEKTRNNPKLQALVHQVYQEAGLNPHQFVVGAPGNHRNKRTGLRQFDEGEGSSGGQGDAAGGGGGGSSGAGTGTGDASGGGGTETGGGADVPGTGGNVPGAGPAAAPSPDAGTIASDPSLGFQEAAPTPAPPSLTGISFIDSLINDFSVPGTLATIGMGMIPGIGPALGIGNMASGFLGGPTISGMTDKALSALGASGGTPASTGSGGSLGSGGSANDVPADQATQDAEWLKRLNLG